MRTFLTRLPFEVTAAVLAMFVAAFTVAGVFGVSTIMEKLPSHPTPDLTAAVNHSAQNPISGVLIDQGHHLFLQNCAHCHADDATGDEGPDLHGVRKSDTKITAIIQNGIKGEMPKFGQKLTDADIRALIAFLRSLDSHQRITSLTGE
ncbi:MAG: cytochrome c [Verrucomicrobiota bacterium]|nr:cytochrome c [Verrucomicrobiota bacterium]